MTTNQRADLTLIAPALTGPPTGGTLYNALLLAALGRAGVSCTQVELEPGLDAVGQSDARLLLVDSLYLDAMPRLRARAPSSTLYLLLHYLPSLVEHGRVVTRDELHRRERDALDLADGFLVTSVFMQRALQAIGMGARPILCVEPAIAPWPGITRAPSVAMRFVMLCSVVASKGVLPLLNALAQRTAPSDIFELAIAGRLDLEPDYAEACRAFITTSPLLQTRVRLLGPRPQSEAHALLASADVFVSASRMESYGMALAEARAAGVPIVARAGGHASAHVDPGHGGELVDDEHALAASLLRLVRDPDLLCERREQAAERPKARSWDDAARELIAQLRAHGAFA